MVESKPDRRPTPPKPAPPPPASHASDRGREALAFKDANRPVVVHAQKSEPQPKELDAAREKAKLSQLAKNDDDRLRNGGASAGGGAAGPTGNATHSNAPGYRQQAQRPSATDPVAEVAPAAVDKPAVATNTKSGDKKLEEAQVDQRKDDASLAAIRQLHERAKQLVSAGKCVEAGKLAGQILQQAPDYYNRNVANDRALKDCAAYIANERDKEAEKQSKSRANKRSNDSESPSPRPAAH